MQNEKNGMRIDFREILIFEVYVDKKVNIEIEIIEKLIEYCIIKIKVKVF